MADFDIKMNEGVLKKQFFIYHIQFWISMNIMTLVKRRLNSYKSRYVVLLVTLLKKESY